MRPSCSGKGLGAGLCPRIPSFSLSGWGFGNQDWGLHTTLLPAFLSLPHLIPGPLGGPQAQLPYLGAFSPARSQHVPLRVLSSLTATWGLCGPHISPSTSALSLFLSHGDFGGRRTRVLPAGPHRMPPTAQWGRGGEVEQPCKARQGMPQWGLGPSRTTSIKQQKLKHWLRATETGIDLAVAMLPCSPVSAGSDCCYQPHLKHVSSDPDSVLCGLMGGLCGRKDTDLNMWR